MILCHAEKASKMGDASSLLRHFVIDGMDYRSTAQIHHPGRKYGAIIGLK